MLEQCEKCQGCNSHFRNMRENIHEYFVSKHITHELDNYREVIGKIVSCQKVDFFELHKFEEKVENLHVFRAKINKIHVVYAVDSFNRMLFLRAFKNFKEYKKFLENKKEILSISNNVAKID